MPNPNESPIPLMPVEAEQMSEEPWEERQPDQEGLLFTLDICRRSLPQSAHPYHWSRLRYLEDMVRYWVR